MQTITAQHQQSDPCHAYNLPLPEAKYKYPQQLIGAKALMNVSREAAMEKDLSGYWVSSEVPVQGSISFVVSRDPGNEACSFETYTGSCSQISKIEHRSSFLPDPAFQLVTVKSVKPGSTVYMWIKAGPRSVGNMGNTQVGSFLPPTPNEQDCPGAIPICQDVYSTIISYSGTGNIPNEINPANSCLGNGERNDVWYTFTVQTSGNLNFLITPVDMADDYDWAVYNLTNNDCEDIYTTPSVMKSCNYSLTPGTTGPNGGSGLNNQNAIGTPYNAVIPVVAGQTYVINVSNFSASASGFTIDFGASTAQIFDNIPPQLQSIIAPACGATSVQVDFSENILCSTIQGADFTLTGPGGPYAVTGWTSVQCGAGADYDNSITVDFSPAITTTGSYDFCLVNTSGSVTDLCGNIAPPSCITFNITGVTAVANSTPVSCYGGSNGTASVVAAGGSGVYNYSWAPSGGAGSSATGLTAGTYTVTVTDGSVCSSSATVVITQPAAYSAVVSGSSDVTCNSASDGTATISVSGGTAPFSYIWSNGFTTASPVNFSGGTFTVTVTDNNGCTATASVTINEPPLLGIALAGTDVSCNGGTNGAVNSNVNGGTPGYSYSWSNGNTNASPSTFSAGSYTVTVTDAGGCTVTSSVTLNEPSALALNVNASNASCGSSNGSASVVANGGTPGYGYLWSNGVTTSANNGLAAGTYDITVTDASGCTAVSSINVANNQGPVISISSSADVSCNGGGDGSASVTVNGGAAPYSYAWSNGNTTSSVTGLTASGYDVTVTDDNGCTASVTVVISEPTDLVLNTIVTPVICNGGNTGDGSVAANGATAPYSYLWSNGDTNSGINNLPAGTYTVTVTDDNGCTSSGTMQVTEPAVLALAPAGADASCNGGNDGSASVAANGGTAPYSYDWSSGSTGSNATGLGAGTYTVTVTDDNGCTMTATQDINEPSPLVPATNTSPAACGSSNGSASVNVNGGTPGYSYLWSDGSTGSSINSIASGSYDVTVTDANGCTAVVNANVGSIAGPAANIAAFTDVTCNSGSDGTASVNANGGAAPYTYLWSNGATASSVTGLSAGTYTVTATDANGCAASASAVISEPTAIAANASPTDVLCNGGSDGSASAAANGGNSPYTYQWSNGNTAASVNNLAAGSYTVTVTDASGCTETAVAVIAEPAAIALAPASTDVSCNGGGDGTASVAVNGGTGPFTYLWSDGSTGTNAGNLTATVYTVTVTDNNGCTEVTSISVSEPALIVINSNSSPATCGSQNGSASVNVNGGTGGYSYLWSNGTTTANNNAVNAGPYDVTVTDANGCTQVTTVNVANTAGPVAAITASADVICNGGADGSAAVGVNGGTAPYSYLWSDGTTTASINNIPAGSYTVTVTDNSGCVSSTTVQINEPGALVLNAVITDVSCDGLSNGDITSAISGASPPYTYLWSNGATAASISSLAAGGYTLTVTDNSGCSDSQTWSVIAPPAILAVMAPTDATCNGAGDGSAAAAVNGGSAPYNYLWSNGDTNDNTPGLTSGTYTVTVTDASGCTITATTVVNEPAVLVVNSNTTPATCGSANGSATVNVNGGSPGYSYLWSDGTTSSTVSSVAAGPYDVTVTDANGCTQFTTVNVSNTAGPVAAISASADVLCNGGNDGSAAVSVNGGTAPYAYLWSDGTTTATVNNIPAGNYAVTVTDNSGCVSSVAVVINEPTLLVVNGVVSDVLCSGQSTGNIAAVAGGATPGYSYLWSNGDTNSATANLTAGNYTLTVTDNNGCTDVQTWNVNAPALLTAVMGSADATCNGSGDGTANSAANGGTGPYGYLWSNGDTNDNLNNLTSGTYTVTVTDASGCTATGIVVIAEPAAMVINSSSSPAACGTANGSASVIISGGISPYAYNWSNGVTSASNNAVAAGPYDITVTDANGCSQMTTVNVSNTAGPVAAISASGDVTCNGGSDGSVAVGVNGGTSPYTYLWSNGDTNSSINNLPAGNYAVTVTDDIGCASSAAIVINEPTALVLNASSTDVGCSGQLTGTASVVANGATSPYTYLWSDGSTGSSISSLAAGAYSVTVTDGNGCSQNVPVSVNGPSALVPVSSAVDVTCNGGTDGSVSVVVNGGTGAYSYLWSTGDTADQVNNAAAGTFTVTVTDASGCTSTASVIVTEPAAIAIGKNTVDATCGSSNGSATANPNGGTAPYQYLWSNGGTTATISNIAAGAYVVTVTDASGCTSTRNITVANSSGPGVSISAITHVSCNTGTNGTATAGITGGQGPFTYLWSDGTTSATISNVQAGDYTITVTDGNGCSSSVVATITEPSGLQINSLVTDVLCHGDATGSASVAVNGATPPYSYLWSNGITAGSISSVTAGAYDITVTDDNGCSTAMQLNVTEPAALAIAASTTDAACNGGSDGTATAVVNGGIMPYSYAWSNGYTTSQPVALASGTYTVTVTDGNGCSSTSAATVNEPAAITIGKNTVAATCGSANGSATAVPNGGTAPYAFSWSNGASTGSVSNIASGNYQVTVTDAMGCTATRNINVPNSSGPVISINLAVDVSCFGGTDGSVTLTVNGGALPYVYLWSDGSTSASLNNVTAGNYSVTVNDNNGCSSQLNTPISEPAILVLNISGTDANCNGESSGDAAVVANGATPPYNYLWTGGSTAMNINAVSSGTYTVTVTDDHGCSASASQVVAEPAALNLAPSSTDALCNGGNDGSVSMNVSGGILPYSYLWNTGDTGGSVSSLPAGNYAVTVTDDHGCSATAAVSVGEPAAIVIGNNTVAALCGGSNGSATAIPVGGTAPYSYLWSNGSSTASISNVTSGAYPVTVTDASGCVVSDVINVPSAAGPVSNITVTNITCNGLQNGSAVVNIAGGAAPFTYLWSSGNTTNQLTGLDTGSYAVTVTDQNGCISYATGTVTEPDVLAAGVNGFDALCHGGLSGSAIVTGYGGTLPYAYAWSNGAMLDSIAGLAASVYTVTISDGNGCTASNSVTVAEPPVLTVTTNVTNAKCNGSSDGAAQVSGGGGTAPYSFSWSTGSTLSAILNLQAGAYTVTVSDNNGCTATQVAGILQPSAMVLNAQVIPSTCGSPNGSATTVINGGVQPYTYAWSSGQTSASINNVMSGSYTITVTDQHGCSLIQPVSIANIAGPKAVVLGWQDASCQGSSDGTATASAVGGTAPLSYLWSNGSTNGTATGLAAGLYIVTVTDFTGCISVTFINITEPALLVPAVVHDDAACYGTATGIATASATGGTAPYTYQWSAGQITGTATGLVAASYTVTVTDDHGCTSSVPVTISEPPALVSAVTATPALCYGAASGTAQVVATGGTSPYSYNWSGGGQASGVNGLMSGTYTVTVTDDHGCQSSGSVFVGQATQLNIQPAITPVLCHGGNTGSVNITVTGGTAGYSYQWSSGGFSGPLASGLVAGTYTVTVTDANQCTTSVSPIVAQPAQLAVLPSSVDITCFGADDGTAAVTPSGGVSPYAYAWSNGYIAGASISQLSPGPYSVTITDNNGCTISTAMVIQEPPQLLLNAAGATTICIGSQAVVSATATGGTGTYQFSWSNGVTTQSQVVTPPVTTSYTASVVDANGCTTTKKTVLVSVYPPLSVVATTDQSICDGASISISAQASGGNGGPYTYIWDNGAGSGSTVSVAPHITTSYTVIAADNCGTPVAQTTVTVVVNALPVVAFDILPAEGCVPLTVSFTNQTITSLQASYEWNFGDLTRDTVADPVHIYTHEGVYDVSLKVTSDMGCVSELTKPQAIHVYGLPVASFTADPPKATILHPVINFTDHSTGASFWNWDFGDGYGNSVETNPRYTYRDAGMYEVTLIVENNYTCTDTVTEQVIIEQDFTLYVPNAFTPNGDGSNDYFLIQGIGINDVQIFVFDRWGNRVFYTSDISEGWNGRINNSGKECQQDAYVYLVKVAAFDGGKKEFTGRVTLLR